jgi:hypothetical protein
MPTYIQGGVPFGKFRLKNRLVPRGLLFYLFIDLVHWLFIGLLVQQEYTGIG